MKMTIDEAISWLLSIAEHEGEDIPIYDTDVEAIKMGIDTIRKYQKIEQLIAMDDENHRRTIRLADLKEIIEDGNDTTNTRSN